MHHNRSLLPNVEVLLGVMVKTSTCSNKLLFVILNFYSRLFSWFWSNFRISKFLAKFHNFAVFRIYLNGQNLNNPIMIWVRFCIFVFFILHCTMGLFIALRISKITKSKGPDFAQFWSKPSEVVWDRWKTAQRFRENILLNICQNCGTYGRKTWMG